MTTESIIRDAVAFNLHCTRCGVERYPDDPLAAAAFINGMRMQAIENLVLYIRTLKAKHLKELEEAFADQDTK